MSLIKIEPNGGCSVQTERAREGHIMKEITLEELLEAGCHFGHQVTRQNPRARDFIFEARDNIHIIDLVKTKEGLDAAAKYIYELAKKGGNLIVVGTKRQARNIVEEEVNKARLQITQNANPDEGNIFYVTNRWIGGLLTNFGEVSKNYKKLQDLTKKLQDSEEKAKYTKKEVGLWGREKENLESFYGGVHQMKKLPDALFIIDTHLEELAVREATRMGVVTVGVVDTNSDPFLIDYPIPANDDAVGSIKLIVSYIIDAWVEGRKAQSLEAQKSENKEEKAAKAEKSENKEEKTLKVKKSAKPETKKKEEKDAKSKSRTVKKTA
ncbi:MAG: 30S ribosomal protein S2 [bacterium]|nr:30S ribosomal protein S2 [bacterium]